MKSMTGFGRGTFGNDSNRVAVTIKTYNSRFLDMKVRGCESDPAIEADIREFLQNNIVRGTAYVTIEPDRNVGQKAAISFNRERFEAIDQILMTIQKDYGRHLEISDLASSNDLISQTDNASFSSKSIKAALDVAYKQVEEMRTSEGARLKNDISQRLKLFAESVDQIGELNSNNSSERKVRYIERIKELMENVEIDETRVAQEIALLVERSDITEEIVRARSHVEQFISLMDLDEPVGKRFNFILQEMGREVNTMGSKSANPDLSKIVIQVKDELEKMREQVQNIL